MTDLAIVAFRFGHVLYLKEKGTMVWFYRENDFSLLLKFCYNCSMSCEWIYCQICSTYSELRENAGVKGFLSKLNAGKLYKIVSLLW